MAAEIKNIKEILPDIIHPLIDLGIYKTPEEALKNILNEHIMNKVSYYAKEIERLKRAYGMSFEEFTKKLKSKKASVKEEDDWMEWESDRNMLKAWKSLLNNSGNTTNAS